MFNSYIEALAPKSVSGWVVYPQRPEAEVAVSLLINGIAVNSVSKLSWRVDLAAAFGPGRHHFRLDLPISLDIKDSPCRTLDVAIKFSLVGDPTVQSQVQLLTRSAEERKRHSGAYLDFLDQNFNYDYYVDQLKERGFHFYPTCRQDALYHYLNCGAALRVSPTPLFDPLFFLSDITALEEEFDSASEEHLLEYYLISGDLKGLRPNRFFDPVFYRGKYDLHRGEVALTSYLQLGSFDGNWTSPLFWSDWYKDRYGLDRDADALGHYLQFGREADFLPNPLIDVDWCRHSYSLTSVRATLDFILGSALELEATPHPLIDLNFVRGQLDRSGIYPSPRFSALEHYLADPLNLDPHPLFSNEYFLRHLGVVAPIYGQPLQHYISLKAPERRKARPSVYFDDWTYLTGRPELAGSEQSPLMHYVTSGFDEDVTPHPLIDHNILKKTTSEPGLNSIAPLIKLAKAGLDTMTEVRPDYPVNSVRRELWKAVAFDLSTPIVVEDFDEAGFRVGLFAHVFYTELAEEVCDVANHFPKNGHLFVSTDTEEKRHRISSYLAENCKLDFTIRVFPNKGRDIAPLIVGFKAELLQCKYALHIHTKRSLHYGRAFDAWRRHLFSSNAGKRELVTSIIGLFETVPSLGAMAPTDFPSVRPLINLGKNGPIIQGLLRLLRVDWRESSALEFPSGSMFWFRVEAMKPLLDLDLTLQFFDDERGQVDGTLAHAIERAFFLVAEAAGFSWIRFFSGRKPQGYEITSDIRFALSRLTPPAKIRSEALIAYAPETENYFCRATSSVVPRLNLLIPTADTSISYAGVSEALRLFGAILRSLGDTWEARIIFTDTPQSAAATPPEGFDSCESILEAESGRRTLVSGISKMREPILLRENDTFVATAWWNASQALSIQEQYKEIFGCEPSRFVYLVQDYESGFYNWSTRFALCENTYRSAERTIAIFNTPYLANFMNGKFSFASQYTYCPPLNETLLQQCMDLKPYQKRRNRILLYFRPHAARNAHEFLIAIVEECRRDKFWDPWEFVAIGEDIHKDQLKMRDISLVGRLDLANYAALIQDSKLAISLMISPHPSYPPLEMAAAGMHVLTNTYEEKDLSLLHSNIHSFELFDVHQVVLRLRSIVNAEPSNEAKVDWFFNGYSNLEKVATVVSEIIGSGSSRRAGRDA